MPKSISKFWGWQTEAWEDPVPLPEELPPVMKFDSEMLPEAFRGWLCDIAERMQVPLDFPAAGVVVVISSLVGRRLGVRPKRLDDWLVVPNLWGMIVGRPALLKTPALAEITKPLERIIAKAHEKYKDDLEIYEIEAMTAEVEQKAFKKRLEKLASKAVESGDRSALTQAAHTEGIEEPEKPVLRRYKTEDATTEKIGELLVENPNGLLYHRDELSGWFRNLDKQGRDGGPSVFP